MTLLATDDHPLGAEIERERFKAVDAFNRVFARWLLAKAKVLGPLPKCMINKGKAYDAYMTKIDRIRRSRCATEPHSDGVHISNRS